MGAPLVVLDAGHCPNGVGTNRLGACYNGLVECAITWDICRRVYIGWTTKAAVLHMTRPSYWDSPTLSERAAIANRIDATMFLSVHCNALPGSTKAEGIETLHHLGSTRGKLVAQAIQDTAVAATGARDRGLRERNDVLVLRTTKMPAAMLESGFLTRKEEAAAISTETYRNDLAAGIRLGIMEGLRAIGAIKF